ncbi:MAG: winged helix-turn-helix domain-containing protein [Chloroflexi bacterium]|nr:winged helix-turn-helix domain-containing protein [Chloroflexota bacterium]
MTQSGDIIEAANLRIDRERYAVTVSGTPIRLTYLEFNALWYIASLDGRIATYDRLAATLWGEPTQRSRRRLAVVLSRLRSKLGGDAAGYVDTVPRVGYRLATDHAA